MDNVQLMSSLKQLFCEEMKSLITDIAKCSCYGCSVDHPSQIQHDICIMSSTDEWTDMFLQKAMQQLNLEKVREKWDSILRETDLTSCDADFVWNQMSKTFKSLATTNDGIEDWSKYVKQLFAS